MTPRALTFFFLFLILPLGASAETKTPSAVFQEANASYRGGDYGRAASLYESLMGEGTRNAALYYNLADACFKQNLLGRAILYYEKARRLDPRDRDISANLHYVKGLLEYRIEDKRNWYAKTLEALLASFTGREIGMASLAFGLFFWSSWAFSLYFHSNRPWGWGRKALLIFTVGCSSLWFLKTLHDASVEEAIVLKPQAAVRYGPSYKDQIALRLGEGLKVRVKKKAGEWSRVLLTNGETGWIFQEEIGVI